jgi:allophanate hydrolase subunit 2
MAYRLEGPEIPHADGFNIVSDGILRGSVQVPGNGRPIVMMADHQTTGGYPKVATVIAADHDALAQQPPGTEIRFEAIAVEEADRARAERARELARLEQGLIELGPGAGLDSERLLRLNLVDGVVDAADDI